ncbi:MFS transporter, partial [Porticoccaceae bacterium]|nr:MFS transporter [Porticoccaceae bacterium]
FLVAFLFAGIGIGSWYGLLFIYADVYLGVGAELPMVFGLSMMLGILTLVAWPKVAARWGKNASWILGMLLVAAGTIGTGLLDPEETSWLILLACVTIVYCGFMAINILAPSLLGDIIDYGTWKFGMDRGATYFALYMLVQKGSMALGGALGLAIAGWSGFDPSEKNHSEMAGMGLTFAIAWLPVVFVFLSIILIKFSPINSRRHAAIRKSLDRRVACIF